MTWQIWLAIASIVFIVFGLVKRLETRMLLIVAGFILCCASGAPMKALKSSKAPTNYFTPNILRKSWSRLVVSVVHLDALAFPVAAT